MYSRMLIPLDESIIAEQVLPYARYLAKALAIPVELLEVVDSEALKLLANPERGRYIDTVLADRKASGRNYLETIAGSFQGARVTFSVENGKAEELIIDKAAADKDTLIVMATHGRSGMQRWLLGSVADKVLHGSTNHLFLIRATEQGKTDGEAALTKVIVPLDGSPLAEKILPYVVDLGKKMRLEVIFLRAYALPPAVTGDEYGTYSQELFDQLETEAKDYLTKKIKEVEQDGLRNVSSVVDLGYGAEEITALARKTPDNFIAMCTHGRSGATRWVLGSVTDRVVRHSSGPVLIIRSEEHFPAGAEG
ncbi:MAG TPA: universal stress protein [Candidatus Limnocylindrales bacterium]|nr:universal stress protein [Candidatus Limnocylindrales bacterium]